MAEISFRVLTTETDESFPPGMDPADAARHVAMTKASAVFHSEAYAVHHQGALVLAADTMVVLDQEILGKPSDRQDADDHAPFRSSAPGDHRRLPHGAGTGLRVQ